MIEKDRLANEFEQQRDHLVAVAYRMLGSLAEAEDAVQETWLRLSRADVSDVGNIGAWLTTVVARLCLDALRARASRKEESIDALTHATRRAARASGGETYDAQHEAELTESVGLAMMVVLETLGPAERVAFVLHDMFDVPFDEIANMMDRSSDAVRQLASRARRRVRGAPVPDVADRRRQSEIVEAYLAASRAGDFDALMAVLDPDVVLRLDRTALSFGGQAAIAEARGSAEVARRVLAVPGRAQAARPAIVNGRVGILVAPRGRLLLVLEMSYESGLLTSIDAIGDPERLRDIELNAMGD